MDTTCDVMEDVRTALGERFGHRDFRQGQARIVDAVMGGCDVLTVMPTGSGKSLCYQLPAVLLPGTTLVVSPLISLMKDQVDELNRRAIRSAALHSMLSAPARREALAAASGWSTPRCSSPASIDPTSTCVSSAPEPAKKIACCPASSVGGGRSCTRRPERARSPPRLCSRRRGS